ncbi:sigma 54-interacting transcriptional regulator [Solidesulfovibrio sp.]|uniref:sigma 54-interacting transcriptional regulator n=1 Tax=Solidesulfovibrio sp. TaxID=2910990 RepID=UPI002638413E|nr:sigma 54-interacting transcriptional regulator [Solidesulfovibrio sp.]
MTAALHEALGQSDAFLAFMERVAAVARADRPVVLVGERGTGKELAAARLHFHSPRWEGPFVAVSLASLPRSLVEAELFGHEAGAFTGAVKRRLGRFEAASGGTLFLDELQATPRPVQEKLLRAVEYGTVERLGASESVSVDARVVAATNVDPRELVARGRLLPDLLDRLAFAVLHVPPLRVRHGDVAYLAERFAARFAAELGRPDPPSFSPSAMQALQAHSWPGNIRELKNTVERAVFDAPTSHITDVVLDPFASPHLPPAGEVQEGVIPSWPPEASSPSSLPSFSASTTSLEISLLRRALAAAGGNQRRAAAMLGLTYHQFRGQYRKHAAALDAGPKAP